MRTTPTGGPPSRDQSWKYDPTRTAATWTGSPTSGPDLLQVHKCTIPSRGPDRVCFVIAVEKAVQQTLSFVHNPGQPWGDPARRRHPRPPSPQLTRPGQP